VKVIRPCLGLLGFVIVLAIFALIYFRLNSIPRKDFQYTGWYFARKWSDTAREIAPTPLLKRLTWRARIDQFVAPFPDTHRILGPVVIQGEGDEVYLMFPESLEGHNVIIYRISNSTNRLLWKAEDSNPP